jgi:hypothetical protein
MTATTPLRCSNTAMATRGTHEVVLLNTGNYPGQSVYLNETATFASGNWTIVSTSQIDPNGPLPLRTNTSAAYDGSTNVVLFGGQGPSETAGLLQDTWLWAGTYWVAATPTASPFARTRHKMATLNATGALMFGGSNVLNFLQETWLYVSSGSTGTWTQLTPANTPAARVDHMMAGNTTTTNVLLFGGKNSNSNLSDTYLWVGGSSGNWVLQNPAFSPPAMSSGAMCFDAANNQYVLFAGQNDDNLLPSTTYVYQNGNGGNWVQIQPQANGTGPAARIGAMMAYDPSSSKVIMFGGYGNGGVAFNETWTFTYTSGSIGTWTQL